MGIQNASKPKNVITLSGHISASFWARDSSKKALFSSWLALSNGMKSEGSAGRAVHVQGDWKLCTCTARRKKIFKPGSRWIRVLRQKLYPGVKNLGNWRNFCKQLGSALSDSTITKITELLYHYSLYSQTFPYSGVPAARRAARLAAPCAPLSWVA